jgi:hypothetical protein
MENGWPNRKRRSGITSLKMRRENGTRLSKQQANRLKSSQRNSKLIMKRIDQKTPEKSMLGEIMVI